VDKAVVEIYGVQEGGRPILRFLEAMRKTQTYRDASSRISRY